MELLELEPLDYLTAYWFSLVRFYGISTLVGHLMPNPFYTFIKYIISKHILENNIFKQTLADFFGTQSNDFT